MIVSSWTGRFVAQIGNLLCRGLATRWSFRSIPALADCQSAKQPTASRRYSMAMAPTGLKCSDAETGTNS